MGRPAKSYLALIQSNDISKKSKAEIEQRKKGEESLLSKVKMREFPETKANPKADLEYKRISKLMKKIEKDDDLFSSVINRYCMLKAECDEIIERREEHRLGIEIRAFQTNMAEPAGDIITHECTYNDVKFKRQEVMPYRVIK